MSDRDNTLDVEFDAQMQGLFQQAERAIGKRGSVVPKPNASDGSPQLVEIDEQPAILPGAIEIPNAHAGPPDEMSAAIRSLGAVSKTIDESVQALPRAVADLRALLEMKNGVSHSMFSALHEELKGYKDDFLLQSVYRPIIRDLVSVYDDLTEIHRQITAAIAETVGDDAESPSTKLILSRMQTMEMNLGHNLEFILEVLARLEVTQFPCGEGKLDKCRQRAIAVEPSDNPEDDTLVVRIVKRGFLWHERVLRPEEVVVKRFQSNARLAPTSAAST